MGKDAVTNSSNKPIETEKELRGRSMQATQIFDGLIAAPAHAKSKGATGQPKAADTGNKSKTGNDRDFESVMNDSARKERAAETPQKTEAKDRNAANWKEPTKGDNVEPDAETPAATLKQTEKPTKDVSPTVSDESKPVLADTAEQNDEKSEVFVVDTSTDATPEPANAIREAVHVNAKTALEGIPAPAQTETGAMTSAKSHGDLIAPDTSYAATEPRAQVVVINAEQTSDAPENAAFGAKNGIAADLKPASPGSDEQTSQSDRSGVKLAENTNPIASPSTNLAGQAPAAQAQGASSHTATPIDGAPESATTGTQSPATSATGHPTSAQANLQSAVTATTATSTNGDAGATTDASETVVDGDPLAPQAPGKQEPVIMQNTPRTGAPQQSHTTGHSGTLPLSTPTQTATPEPSTSGNSKRADLRQQEIVTQNQVNAPTYGVAFSPTPGAQNAQLVGNTKVRTGGLANTATTATFGVLSPADKTGDAARGMIDAVSFEEAWRPLSEWATAPGRADVRDGFLSTMRAVTDPGMPRHIAQQLLDGARAGVDRPVELFLEPAELGRVRMTMAAGDGTMVVTLNVERAETADLLRRNLETLAQEFRNLGYDSLSFEFAGGSADQESASEGSQNEGGQIDLQNQQSGATQGIALGNGSDPLRVVLSDRMDLRL